MKSQPVEGVPDGGVGVVLEGEGEGEVRGELTGPVLPPTDLPQLGGSQHQGGLLGEVEQWGQQGWGEELLDNNNGASAVTILGPVSLGLSDSRVLRAALWAI